MRRLVYKPKETGRGAVSIPCMAGMSTGILLLTP